MSRKLTMSACVGLLALSACALASTASAQWMVAGTNLTGTQKMLEKVTIHRVGELKAAGVTITCKGSKAESTSAQIEAGDKASTQGLTFNECSANNSCTVGSTLKTVPLTATAVLGAGSAVNLTFKPKTKTILATIKFEGAECATLGVQPVSGSAKALAPTGQTEQEAQFVEANTSEASGELKVGSSAASIRCAWLELIEIHRTWSFL